MMADYGSGGGGGGGGGGGSSDDNDGGGAVPPGTQEQRLADSNGLLLETVERLAREVAADNGAPAHCPQRWSQPATAHR